MTLLDAMHVAEPEAAAEAAGAEGAGAEACGAVASAAGAGVAAERGASAVARVAPRAAERRGVRALAAEVAPAWFATVMGTGVLAVAAELLPVRAGVLDGFAVVAWVAAAVLLGALLATIPGNRARWRATAGEPALGVPPMALMTVAAATALAGRHVIGEHAALIVALALWSAGTAAALVVAVAVPAAMVTRHRPVLADASGAWVLPLVPPMVSATTGAGLVAHVPAGQARLDLLLFLYALFGLSLLPTLLTVGVVWARLLLHGPGPAERAPALWVVLGPLGQSITAASLLGAAAAHTVDGPAAHALRAFGLMYGVIVWGFAVLWLALAIVLTRHHASRDGVPFTAAWWSFVFPVGTLVTGTSELAIRTGSDALRGGAVVLFIALLGVWAVTAARSGGAVAGRLGLRRA
ncbi:MAG TPA: C4-dicarboxylate ABC transporter [Baekduia sp.]|uniref:SLAC1 family transporter n=1 Tax=Baekduia sp. TaxID=2600305 RepID=UPI002D76E2B6|nr:C4-dicarboxylate ABC transporter [Baekduia sp.]HET6506050.1 C4-dicarboxylate ABC transporter [Baekduia sp.]